MSATKGQEKRLQAYVDEEILQTPKRFQWETFFAFLKEVWVYKSLFSFCCVLILIVTFATVIQPLIFGYAIDHAILPKDINKLGWITLLFFITEVLRFTGTAGSSYLFTLLSQQVMQSLRMRLLDRIIRFPVKTFDETISGKLVTRITNDVASLADMFTSGLISMLQNIMVVIGTLISVLLIDLKTGLVAISLMPLLILVSLKFSGRLREAYKQARAKLAAMNAFLAETLNGIRVLQLFGHNRLSVERYQTLNRWYADSQFGTTRIYALFHPSITLASGFSMVLVILYGSLRVHDDTLTLGSLVAIFTYTVAIYQPFRDIADKWNIFLSGMVSAERVFQLLRWPVEEENSPHAHTHKVNPSQKTPCIRFEDVWFAYKGEEWVLKGLTLTIEAGKFAGIVGPTGSGKTTLIGLLLRFYEPQKGQIWIDDREIRTIPRHELRPLFGLIQQEGFLFSGTAQDNLSLWQAPNETLETLTQNLLKDCGSSMHLEQHLSERASNLSAGERQILTFSRALYQNPPVWILDEATANVDTQTEEKLEEHLREYSKDRTLLVVAHRLSTLKKADQIVVLHKGQLIENGSHKDLMKHNGLYARLYRVQEAAFQANVTPS